jgi:hypothetical protein
LFMDANASNDWQHTNKQIKTCRKKRLTPNMLLWDAFLVSTDATAEHCDPSDVDGSRVRGDDRITSGVNHVSSNRPHSTRDVHVTGNDLG